MNSKLVLAGAAAAALVAAPLAAQAAPIHRMPAAIGDKNERIVGLIWQYLLLPLIIGAVVAVIAGGHDKPASP